MDQGWRDSIFFQQKLLCGGGFKVFVLFGVDGSIKWLIAKTKSFWKCKVKSQKQEEDEQDSLLACTHPTPAKTKSEVLSNWKKFL
jgi:hypothetical protein